MAFGCSSLCVPVQSSESVQDRFEDVALVHAAALVHRLPALMLSFAHPTPADCKRLDVTAVAWSPREDQVRHRLFKIPKILGTREQLALQIFGDVAI